jgi:hypothetical protein
MSWLSYVDYSSTHAAGLNLVSTGCHFPTLHSLTSQASFETPSPMLNTEMRLLATNSFLGCRRFLSVSEGALTAEEALLNCQWKGTDYCAGWANLETFSSV